MKGRLAACTRTPPPQVTNEVWAQVVVVEGGGGDYSLSDDFAELVNIVEEDLVVSHGVGEAGYARAR